MKLRLLLLLALAALARGEGELTVNQALELAMRQNPAVQAIYRQVDMSQAEQDQVSLLVNPVSSASVGFPDQAGAQNRTEFALSWNLLDLLRRSDREALASTRMRQARLQMEDSLLELIFEVLTVVKVRDRLPNGYQDPGWYRQPAGTQARPVHKH